MSMRWWEDSIRYEAREMGGLLALLDKDVETEFDKVSQETDAFENTPLEPGTCQEWLEGRRGQLDDDFWRMVKYKLWVYGGFMVTVLAWLGDHCVWHTNQEKHPRYAVFMANLGEQVKSGGEPFLAPILKKWLVDDPALTERLCTWQELRNRFVHSYGVVANAEDRSRFARVLGVEFDNDKRMMLTGEMCRSLLADAEEAAVHVGEVADT